MNNLEFIKKSNKIHNKKYKYPYEYTHSKTKIKILCEKHGFFEQLPHNHMNGQKCPNCAKENRRKNQKDFVIQSNNIHNSKYTYLDNYINDKTKISILCKDHGIFKQSPNNHLKGHGCPKCNGGVLIDTFEFVKKSKQIHFDKYDYSLVKYKNIKTKIKIICINHGVFNQTPHEHLSGRGCPICVGKGKNHEDFIKQSKKIHSDKYNYIENYKNMKQKINIECPVHGVFKQSPDSHLRGSGCPLCKNSLSETHISNFLKNNKIKFIREKKFENCKYIKKLKFDFYLEDFNMCIEYDGIQHFEPVKIFGGIESLNKQKIKDKIKNDFCLKNNIKLIRISYKDNINDILKKTFT